MKLWCSIVGNTVLTALSLITWEMMYASCLPATVSTRNPSNLFYLQNSASLKDTLDYQFLCEFSFMLWDRIAPSSHCGRCLYSLSVHSSCFNLFVFNLNYPFIFIKNEYLVYNWITDFALRICNDSTWTKQGHKRRVVFSLGSVKTSRSRPIAKSLLLVLFEAT